MTTEWQRDDSADPRFDLTEIEVAELKLLTALLSGEAEFAEGEGVGAVRAFINGEPVVVIILHTPSGEDHPEAADMRPMAVLMNEAVFDLITPPPSAEEAL